MSWVSTGLKILGQGAAYAGLDYLLNQGEGGGVPAIAGPAPLQVMPGGAPAVGAGAVVPYANGNGGGVHSVSQPFSAQRCGTGVRAVAQVHCMANPITGKAQWFGPGRITFHANKQRRRCRPR